MGRDDDPICLGRTRIVRRRRPDPPDQRIFVVVVDFVVVLLGDGGGGGDRSTTTTTTTTATVADGEARWTRYDRSRAIGTYPRHIGVRRDAAMCRAGGYRPTGGGEREGRRVGGARRPSHIRDAVR